MPVASWIFSTEVNTFPPSNIPFEMIYANTQEAICCTRQAPYSKLIATGEFQGPAGHHIFAWVFKAFVVDLGCQFAPAPPFIWKLH